MDSETQACRPQQRLVISFVLVNALLLFGCAPADPPRFTPSADVKALSAASETEEDKQLTRNLQAEISSQLSKACGSPLAPKGLLSTGFSNERLTQGAEVFARRCQPCHGTNGDGAGPVAQYLKPLPRDYSRGIFKFVSTPLGSRPRRSDLIRTLRSGVTGTSMPSFADLPPDELEAVIDYVIYLSQRGQLEHELAALADQEQALDPEAVKTLIAAVVQPWSEAQNQTVMPLTLMPRFTPETVAKGKALFEAQACNKCHGLDGRGGSFGGLEVGKDTWGHTAAAADLTSGMFHGGGRPIDIYRRICGGINGTPMPGFSKAFAKSPDDIWCLVHFVRDMGERRRQGLPPISAPSVGPKNQPATSSPASSTSTSAPTPQPRAK